MYLVPYDVYLVLDLGDPLPDDGEQLWDRCVGAGEDLLAGRVVGVEEGEGWGGHRRGT